MMIVINRHNYETYFLLWVDGELSSEEKVAVERFVAENPDMAEELALLQSTQLHPDETLVFKGKEILYKREGQDISLNNYEEWFLLYTDNELSEEQKIQVELFVLQHPDLQREFEYLQQTRLPEENWVFANKEILYRRTTERPPVLYMRWMRYAAAAAVIGIMATVWMLAPTNTLKEPLQLEGSTPEIVGNQGNATDPVQNPSQSVDQIQSVESASDESSSNRPMVNSVTAENLPTIKIVGGDQQPKLNKNKVSEEQVIASVVSNNNPIVQLVETQPATNQRENAAGNSSVSQQQLQNFVPVNVEKANNTIAAADNAISSENQSEKAIAATEELKPIYTALEDDDEDKSLYIGALEINKDRLRGLFRKAGSIFRSKSKQNEEDGRNRK